MTNIESIGMDIAIIVAVMTNREIEKMNNHNNNHNNEKNREKANVDSEFVGKIVVIFDDVVEVKDEIGQIQRFNGCIKEDCLIDTFADQGLESIT